MNDLCGPRNEVTYICCLEFVLSLNVVYFANPTTKELFDFSLNWNTLSSYEMGVKETNTNKKDRKKFVSYTCLIINYNKILCYQLLGFRLLLCVPALNFLFVTLFSVAFSRDYERKIWCLNHSHIFFLQLAASEMHLSQSLTLSQNKHLTTALYGGNAIIVKMLCEIS